MSSDHPTNTGMSGRYATALFDLAREGDALDAVGEDLTQFEAMLDESEALESLVRSPVFSADDQERALGAVLDAAKFSDTTTNFLKLVARNRRLFAVRDMVRGYRALVSQHKGEITAEVTSAVALTDEQSAALGDTIKASLGQEVQIVTSVDETLLGGLVVKVGSRMIDNSLKTKLDNLKIAMKEVG